MSIFQFLRILWAHRLLIAACTICCLIGGVIAAKVIPPRWTGTARLMLNGLKPDPVTGEVVMNGVSARTFVATQAALINDYSVAGKVSEQLGWLSDPGMIRAYRSRSAADTRDFRHWLAQNVIDRAKATLVNQGQSNIMEISFTASKAEDARAVADALRRAYIDVSLTMRREDANRNADWFTQQAEKARTELDAANTAYTEYQRENGIVMADATTDLDTARMKALASGSSVLSPTVEGPPSSVAIDQLAQVEADISLQSRTLGPNHPDILTLKAKKAAIQAEIVSERQAQAAASAKAKQAQFGAEQAALQTQKVKVMGQRDKLARLAQLQSEVAMRKSQFDMIQQRAAQLRLQAAVVDTGVTSLGPATVPAAPTFPNKPLIVGGALVLGLGIGFMAALLVELFARRVRSVEDLQHAVDAPMLAVISGPSISSGGNLSRGLARRVNWPIRRKAVQG